MSSSLIGLRDGDAMNVFEVSSSSKEESWTLPREWLSLHRRWCGTEGQDCPESGTEGVWTGWLPENLANGLPVSRLFEGNMSGWIGRESNGATHRSLPDRSSPETSFSTEGISSNELVFPLKEGNANAEGGKSTKFEGVSTVPVTDGSPAPRNPEELGSSTSISSLDAGVASCGVLRSEDEVEFDLWSPRAGENFPRAPRGDSSSRCELPFGDPRSTSVSLLFGRTGLSLGFSLSSFAKFWTCAGFSPSSRLMWIPTFCKDSSRNWGYFGEARFFLFSGGLQKILTQCSRKNRQNLYVLRHRVTHIYQHMLKRRSKITSAFLQAPSTACRRGWTTPSWTTPFRHLHALLFGVILYLKVLLLSQKQANQVPQWWL